MNVKQIAAGLYQGPLYDAVQEWKTLEPSIDVVLVMTHESGDVKIPRGKVDVMPFHIIDSPSGLDDWTFQRLSGACAELASRRVLTACYKGENRAGLASALILVHRGMTPEEAIRIVQQNGPVSTPGHKTALWNVAFANQVRAMEKAA